jgi:hypothetical protein
MWKATEKCSKFSGKRYGKFGYIIYVIYMYFRRWVGQLQKEFSETKENNAIFDTAYNSAKILSA